MPASTSQTACVRGSLVKGSCGRSDEDAPARHASAAPNP